MLRWMKAITALVAALPLMAAAPPAAPPDAGPAAVFALIDNNEWCPGGSVYLDLQTGSFSLFPRLARRACSDPNSPAAVEHGTLGAAALHRLRSAYVEARRAGLEREPCEFVISNGGPQAVVITAPAYSAKTPDNEGCWSPQANALYDELFRVFGRERLRRHSAYRPASTSQEALMDEIERAVVLPKGANPLDAYGRNYAYTGADKIVAIYLLPSPPLDLSKPGSCHMAAPPSFTMRPCTASEIAEISSKDARAFAAQTPAGERRWYADPSNLPGVSDGGCMQVTVHYDVAAHRVLGAACN